MHELLPRLLAPVNAAADLRLPAVLRLLSRWNGQRTDPDRDGPGENPADRRPGAVCPPPGGG